MAIGIATAPAAALRIARRDGPIVTGFAGSGSACLSPDVATFDFTRLRFIVLDRFDPVLGKQALCQPAPAPINQSARTIAQKFGISA
jgi:hypothetical protein